MLAQRISSINSLSALCEKTGADIDELSKAIGMDHRIGPKFLKTSVGFGGSCFQKDILNLVYLCNHFGLDEVAEYWYQVLKINNYQKNRFAQKIIDDLGGDVKGQIITVLGWAFKANTNDSRESAAIHVTNKLLEAGARVKIYDPMVKEDRIRMDLKLLWELSSLNDKEMKKRNDLITIDKDRMAALSHSVAIAILTEWEEFKNYKWDVISKYQKIYDGRKIIQKDISSVDSIYSIGS
jgi:UDPglucose 6-dehydrogenase